MLHQKRKCPTQEEKQQQQPQPLSLNDIIWLLVHFPKDIVLHVISGYCPLAALFLSNVDWKQQCKLIFQEEMNQKWYYNMCFRGLNPPTNKSLGEHHTILTTSDGHLWGCGRNLSGQLGIGNHDRSVLQQVVNKDVKDVYSGRSHSIVLMLDGTLWSCGDNSCGQLFHGDQKSRFSFEEIKQSASKRIIQVSCGLFHSILLAEDGTLYACGDNFANQLGSIRGHRRKYITIMWNKITNAPKEITRIACGRNQTFVQTRDGTLYVTDSDALLHMKEDIEGMSSFKNISFGIPKDIIGIYAGGHHAVFLTEKGRLYGYGDNKWGQLGLGNTFTEAFTFTEITETPKERIIQVCCGGDRTFILTENGKLYACGDNSYGELGLGDTTDQYVFEEIKDMKHVVTIYCGGHHTVIRKADESLWSCGCNGDGQLGLGDLQPRSTFTKMVSH